MHTRQDKKANSAIIFDIERFAIHDGPGIRTVVFFKGCGLRCLWCANPESQRFKPEVIFKPSVCKGCKKCIESCKQGAITANEFGFISSNECIACGNCVDSCVYDAREIVGEEMSVTKVTKEVLRDLEYYRQSGGGVTFSGGEPLLQAPFAVEIAKELKKHNISVLLETCGFFEFRQFISISSYLDMIYFDVKHMDTQIHKKLTGVDNTRILDNLKNVDRMFKGEVVVRYPYIPSCNDDKQSIESFLRFVSNLQNINKVEFLPYHRLGWPKYVGLGREYILSELKALKSSDLSHLQEYQKKYNLEIKIG